MNATAATEELETTASFGGADREQEGPIDKRAKMKARIAAKAAAWAEAERGVGGTDLASKSTPGISHPFSVAVHDHLPARPARGVGVGQDAVLAEART